jgi:hypothetical protein
VQIQRAQAASNVTQLAGAVLELEALLYAPQLADRVELLRRVSVPSLPLSISPSLSLSFSLLLVSLLSLPFLFAAANVPVRRLMVVLLAWLMLITVRMDGLMVMLPRQVL